MFAEFCIHDSIFRPSCLVLLAFNHMTFSEAWTVFRGWEVTDSLSTFSFAVIRSGHCSPSVEYPKKIWL
jgi:hypothetical protein